MTVHRKPSRTLAKFVAATALFALVLPSQVFAEPEQPLVVRHSPDVAFPAEAAVGVPDTPLITSIAISGGAASPTDRTNRPGRVDERPRVLHSGTTEALFSAHLTAPALSVSPKLRPDWMLAHYINVGQGNATLLEFSCGVALIDTGGQGPAGTAKLIAYLNGVFARRADLNRTIALVVLTHPHSDHTSGVAALTQGGANQFTISNIVTNAGTSGSGWVGQKKLLDYGAAKGVPVTLVSNESIVRSDGLTTTSIDPLACSPVDPDIRVLWGTDNQGHTWAKNQNDDSVVVRVDFGESSFVFTGDLEDDAQPEFLQSYSLNPDIIDVDVYEVGHHGSKNGTTAQLLQVIKPEIAVVSAGNPAAKEPGFSAYNFGHPNKIAIGLLSNPTFGVSMTRPTGTFPVGVSGKAPNSTKPPVFESETISKAIFSTGWDGNIVIAASATGQKVVQTQQ
ncbi:ComEC/Rec2 family competence protein [Sphingomonas sp. SUN039]|uniref:ComEC/Rec2 family competence protein n=1 Tax=Sphingomonas sp. SUN039 TaxID=2937787 RepID=UPI002164A64A|nr:MBL fold metallo-hydrolase [Sphingomonas sp. SUN039]UVO53053.1 MBL fold metallo-hydrolase [Sphingomonas sp. SUN039]